MLMAHRIALAPNDKQATYFARAAGTARFAYNWALAEWQKQYAAWQADNSLPKPNQYALRRQLNAIKREQFPWMLEVTKCAPQSAIVQLGAAFKNFFAGLARYPKFRKKGVHERFSLSNDQFKVCGRRFRVPGLGWVRMREALRFQGKIMSAVISRTADRWFVGITVEVSNAHRAAAENQGAVGVDLGVSALATLSTGERFFGPKPLRALLERLQRLCRSLARKRKGSRNRRKAKARLSRLHAQTANIRQNALHQLTSVLTSRFRTICIEDLNVRGMVKNRHLSRSIGDMGFFEFRRQLICKAALSGGDVRVADRFFASSKLCSCCGHRLSELALSVREWVCPGCGSRHDRDVNAALNLRNLAVSSTVSACGEEGSGPFREGRVKPASVKQEANSKHGQI